MPTDKENGFESLDSKKDNMVIEFESLDISEELLNKIQDAILEENYEILKPLIDKLFRISNKDEINSTDPATNQINQSRLSNVLNHLANSLILECKVIKERLGIEVSSSEQRTIIKTTLDKIARFTQLFDQLDDVRKRSKWQNIGAELEHNREDLSIISDLIHHYTGKRLSIRELYLLQPDLFDSITSNKPFVTGDVNYRLNANSIPGSHHSLVPPVFIKDGEQVNSLSEYHAFIEAVTGHSSDGLCSSLGFMHFVSIGEDGVGFQTEFPVSMIDNKITDIKSPLIKRILAFDIETPYNHDLFHHLLPVYADHFILHHPEAPISLGGRLDNYKTFGKKLRHYKEEYELALGIGHAELQKVKSERNPEYKKRLFARYNQVLQDLELLGNDMDDKNLHQSIVRHLGVLFIGRLMTIFPPNSPEFLQMDFELRRLGIGDVTIQHSEILDLILGQGLIPLSFNEKTRFIEEVERINVDLRSYDLIDKLYRRSIKKATPNQLNSLIEKIDENNPGRETGSEFLLQALYEIGILPFNQSETEITLNGLNGCRWLVIDMPQRRQLKGYVEKIHSIKTLSYGSEREPVTVYDMIVKQHEALTKDSTEYARRKLVRVETQKLAHTLYEFTNHMVTSKDSNHGQSVQILNKMINNLRNSTYQRLNQSEIDWLRATMASKNSHISLDEVIERYQILCGKESVHMKNNEFTYIAKKQEIIDETMSIS
jgi:hypothetical protein